MPTNQQIQFRDRQALYSAEDSVLAGYAFRSRDAEGKRVYSEPLHPYRTAFQRDRDRIIHSKAFRRLKHKRQVFSLTKGDHFRTRLTHTMEVAQIGRTIARSLGVNEDLVEAIALGHDLGHAPFGHLGEVVLNEILNGKYWRREATSGQKTGGFKHNYQSLRVIDLLELKYQFRGLNLTAPVREGILKHTRLKKKQIQYSSLDFRALCFEHDHATTIEGQVVAMADEIAQRTHDLEDGLRAGLVTIEMVRELPVIRYVERTFKLEKIGEVDKYLYQNRIINGLVDLLVSDLVEHTCLAIRGYCSRHASQHLFLENVVCFGPLVNSLQNELNKFIYKHIILVPAVNASDEILKKIILVLFDYYFERPELLSEHLNTKDLLQKDSLPRVVCDYIAGMTDTYALDIFKTLQKNGLVPHIDTSSVTMGSPS